MTAPKELSTPRPELTFFAQEIVNRLGRIPPAERIDAFADTIRVTAELTREIIGRSPELVDEFIRSCQIRLGGLH